MRGFFGFLFGLIVIGLLIGLGTGIYQAGVSQGIIDAGRFPAGGPVPVAGYGWHGPDIFGLLFGLFFLFLIFGLIRAAFSRGRGWGPGWSHHGYYGYGSDWGKGDTSTERGPAAWREERDRRIADLHRRLHEEGEGGGSGGGQSSGSAGSNTGR